MKYIHMPLPELIIEAHCCLWLTHWQTSLALDVPAILLGSMIPSNYSNVTLWFTTFPPITISLYGGCCWLAFKQQGLLTSEEGISQTFCAVILKADGQPVSQSVSFRIKTTVHLPVHYFIPLVLLTPFELFFTHRMKLFPFSALTLLPISQLFNFELGSHNWLALHEFSFIFDSTLTKFKHFHWFLHSGSQTSVQGEAKPCNLIAPI